MSPYKDKQIDDVVDTRTLQRYSTRGAYSHTQPPPNLSQRAEKSRKIYRDEHPEIPIASRASRRLDQPPSGSGHLATKVSELETEPTRRVIPVKKQKKLYETQQQYPKPMSKALVSGQYYPQFDTSPALPQLARSKDRGPYDSLKSQPRYPRRKATWLYPFLPQFVRRQHWLKSTGLAIGFLLLLLVINSLFHTPTSGIFAVFPGMSDGITDPHKLMITPINTDHPAPPVYAQAAYLLDVDTGNTFYAHNPFKHLPIMSTTKLMTALLAAEHGNLDQTVTINNQIANDINHLPPDSSNINLKAGESYTLRQLMYGLLLASGNDAAIAIASTVGGSYSDFVAMMNQKATALELRDTHFENPHGLQQPNHFSSAHDLAIIGSKSLSNPIVREISGTLNYHIDQSPQHPVHDFFNGNQFIWWYPGVDAGKPGYDAATNFVQVVSCVRNGHHLIGVTIHTIDWWTDMRNLMNWGFNTYTWISPRDRNTADHAIPYANLWGNFARDQKENAIPTADHGRYYVFTGYSITGDIANYFDKNGGITSFGFPTSQPSDAGNNMQRQRFERGTIQCNTQSKQCQKGP